MKQFNTDKRFKASPEAFGSRVQFLVIHSIGFHFEKSVSTLKGEDPQFLVSTHYLISDQVNEKSPSRIYQLVDENKRAFQAGVSEWAGCRSLNSASIGIEIINPDSDKNPYQEEQIEAVIFLAKDIIKRHDIKPIHVIGHSDIAPDRKTDPGLMFPWKTLFENNIGIWPNQETVDTFKAESLPDASTLQKAFHTLGYPIEPTGAIDQQTKAVAEAFQRHFRQSKVDGVIDNETWAILSALNKKYC